METRSGFSPLGLSRQRRIPFWIAIRLFFSHHLAIFGIVFTFMGGTIAYLLSDDDVFKIKYIEVAQNSKTIFNVKTEPSILQKNVILNH